MVRFTADEATGQASAAIASYVDAKRQQRGSGAGLQSLGVGAHGSGRLHGAVAGGGFRG